MKVRMETEIQNYEQQLEEVPSCSTRSVSVDSSCLWLVGYRREPRIF
jgi:hypothetical protein